MRLWIGFSPLTGVAATSSVQVPVKERGMQAFTFLPMKTSFQDLLTLPVLNRNPNARTSAVLINATPVSSPYP